MTAYLLNIFHFSFEKWKIFFIFALDWIKQLN